MKIRLTETKYGLRTSGLMKLREGNYKIVPISGAQDYLGVAMMSQPGVVRISFSLIPSLPIIYLVLLSLNPKILEEAEIEQQNILDLSMSTEEAVIQQQPRLQ